MAWLAVRLLTTAALVPLGTRRLTMPAAAAR
jgi:hypothetical protein